MRPAVVAALIAGFLGAIPGAAPAVAQTPYLPQPTPEPGMTVCPDGLCGAQALDGLFEALWAAERGLRDRPVHLLQLGDSHTAGDQITGALRARMQARFGRAGRGVLPPGPPYAGYRAYQVEMAAEDWVAPAASLQAGRALRGPAMGLAGARALLGGDRSGLELIADPGRTFSAVGLCGARGGVRVLTDAGDQDAGFDPDGARMACRRLALDPPVERLTLRPAAGGGELHSLWLEDGSDGVTISALGVVGATLGDLAARDEAMIATELAMWRPNLIVLAFGTNEGFDPAIEAGAYEVLLRGQIARLRSLAPAASLLILGAPDALARSPGGRCGGERAPPPGLAVVRDVQRRVAADMGVAFWDWHGRMGGDCSADRLATAPEPLMRGDRVHFTSAGADWIGGVLSGDLTAAYDAWKVARAAQAGEGG